MNSYNSDSPDLGRLFLDKIWEKMMIDEEWSVREPHRIEWWPHELRQSIWVDAPFDDEGITIWRVHCRTDLIRGFGGSADECHLIMDKAMYSTLSGLARNANDSSRVQMASSLFFHEETFEWAWEMMSWIAGIQAMEAHRDAEPIAERRVNWEFDSTSHPDSGSREEPDDLLNLGQFARIQGITDSMYAGSEMLRMKDILDGPPSLWTTGDELVISAEYPFPVRSMLLKASCRELNMNLGHGLLTLLKLPDNPGGKLPESCLEFNERELQSLTRCHFVGSWCDDPGGTRTYVTFLPNVLFSPATMESMVMGVMMRAMWISHDLLDYSWAEHYQQDSAKKMQSLLAYSKKNQSKPNFFNRLFRGRH
jgi:hypothetical protein